ncbi:hypothetical protein FRC07_010591 [Ceratobasidium sp. 392]|nr:hypothetical protein FRC07_010591 [Ceratobasidium sp. 392]
MTSTDPALESSLLLLEVLCENRPGKLWRYIEHNMLRPLCSLASELLSASTLSELAGLMHELAKQNGKNSSEEDDEDADMDNGEQSEASGSGSEDQDMNEQFSTEQDQVASLLANELRSELQARGASTDRAKGVAKCLAAVARGQKRFAAMMVEECSASGKPSASVNEDSLVLNVLTLCEIGCFVTANQRNIFGSLHDFLSSDSERVRNAAVQAIGDMCVESSEDLVSVVMDNLKGNKARRALLLRSLEVVG